MYLQKIDDRWHHIYSKFLLVFIFLKKKIHEYHLYILGLNAEKFYYFDWLLSEIHIWRYFNVFLSEHIWNIFIILCISNSGRTVCT